MCEWRKPPPVAAAGVDLTTMTPTEQHSDMNLDFPATSPPTTKTL